MPDPREPALQPRIAGKPSRYLRQTRLQRSSDQAQSRRQRGRIAHIVSELHRPLSITRLAGGVHHHGERPVKIVRHARFGGEECLRRERPHIALYLNRDPLPGAKMPRIALRRRVGGPIEKNLYAIHIVPARFYRTLRTIPRQRASTPCRIAAYATQRFCDRPCRRSTRRTNAGTKRPPETVCNPRRFRPRNAF